MTERTLFDELGGEARLRAIIERFVDKNVDDPMIGFFFQGVSRERLKQKEYEFAAQHLGAPIAYRGRPIAEAHGRHPIMGGQFMRRLQILKETLIDFDVPRTSADTGSSTRKSSARWSHATQKAAVTQNPLGIKWKSIWPSANTERETAGERQPTARAKEEKGA